jgi:type VI secretion system protein ImpF
LEFARAPAVRSSVINFGLPALSGKPASSLEVIDLERAVRQAIVEFEPRILPATLRVKALIDVDRLDHHNVIAIEIRGELWAQPVPLELEVRTEIDLETGRVRITELGTPGAA